MDCTDCILYDYCIGDTDNNKICGKFIKRGENGLNYNGDPLKFYYNIYIMDMDGSFLWQILKASNNTGREVIVAEGEEKELNTAVQKACAARYEVINKERFI